MIDNFQKEIPRSRINITLDVEIGGAKQKKELPLKILAINDFSAHNSAVPVVQRERININKVNFDEVMAHLSPELNLNMPNMINNHTAELKSRLIFKKYRDFHPENIVTQIPELRNLLSMRNLLKDLKANILDNYYFRQALENILKEPAKLEIFKDELKKNCSFRKKFFIELMLSPLNKFYVTVLKVRNVHSITSNINIQ